MKFIENIHTDFQDKKGHNDKLVEAYVLLHCKNTYFFESTPSLTDFLLQNNRKIVISYDVLKVSYRN